MTLDLRLKAYAPNGASQGILPAPQDFSLAVPLNDTPSLTLNYGVKGPRSDLLGQPLEIAVEVTGDNGATWVEPDDCRFLYLRDGRDPIKTADTWQAEAPGYLWRLQKARVLDEAQAVDGVRKFENVTPGAVLTTLWTEAQSRGALSGMTLTGGAANDAAGTAWGTTLTRSYDLGTDYLQVLLELAQAGFLDFRMTGRTLKVYRPDVVLATDRTVGNSQVQLTPTVVTEAPFRRTWEGLADFLHVAGDEGSTVGLTNVSALKPWGRWEDYITQGGVSDAGTLTAIGQRYQALTATERAEFTQGLALAGGPDPLLSFMPGDYIWSRDLAGVRTKYRVRQVTLEKSGGTVQGNVVLNDRFLEEDIRTRRIIDGITGGASSAGSTGGTPGATLPGADILQPAAPTAPVVTSASYQDHRGNALAQITVNWADVTTNLDGTPLTDLDHYEVQTKAGATNSTEPWVQVTESEDSLATLSPYVPGAVWSFRVRAVDTSNNWSPWSPAVQVTAAGDTTPPPKPSTPTQTARNSLATLVWDGLTSTAGAQPLDFAYAEVHVTTTNVAPAAGSATMRGTLDGRGQYPITGIPYGATHYGWVIPRDRSGNAGPASNSVALTAPFTTAEDILNGAINTAHVSGALFTGTVIPNPGFEEWNADNTAPLGWTTLASPITKETAAPLSGAASVRCNSTATTASGAETTQGMPVVPLETYYLAATARYPSAGATSTNYVAVRWHDATGAFISQDTLNWSPSDTTAIRRERAVTAPANARTAKLRVWATAGDAIGIIVDELDWRRLVTTALIQDLAVSNAKISSLAVDKLTTGLLQANQRIVAGGLTGARAEMNPGGFEAYNASSVRTFWVDAATGNAEFLGTIKAGSAIDGATVTGGIIQTTTGNNGIRMQNDGSGGIMEFFHGRSGYNPGHLQPSWQTRPVVTLASGSWATNGQSAYIDLKGGTSTAPTTTEMFVAATVAKFNGQVHAGDGLKVGNFGTYLQALGHGTVSATTNASGIITVTHGMSKTPTATFITRTGTGGAAVWMPRIANETSTTFDVQWRDAGTGALANGVVLAFQWLAIAA